MLDGMDEVYHLAAAVGVRLIAESPIHTIETNVYPMELLLDGLSKLHAAGRTVRLFLASTSEVYGKNPKSVWREDDDMVFGPTRGRGGRTALRRRSTSSSPWPIGTSGSCRRSWAASSTSSVRGRRAGYGMVLPRLVDAALSGGPLVVHDDGQQERCFAHVGNVVRAVLALMQSPRPWAGY